MYFEIYANGGVYTCPECILKHMRMVVFTPVRNVCSGAEAVRLGAVVPGEDP